MMNEETSLEDCYKYVYTCACGKEYGSDKKENGEHICPKCEDKDK